MEVIQILHRCVRSGNPLIFTYTYYTKVPTEELQIAPCPTKPKAEADELERGCVVNCATYQPKGPRYHSQKHAAHNEDIHILHRSVVEGTSKEGQWL